MGKKKYGFRLLYCGFMLAYSLLTACSGPESFDLNNQPVHFSKYHGKWIIISYWAEWCGTCLDEIKEFNRFHAAHHKSDAIVLGFNSDKLSVAVLKDLQKKYNIEFPLLKTDPGPALNLWPPSGLPMTVFISPEGKIYKTMVGPQTVLSLERIISRKINE
ncbi:MAG: Thiol-disulfide oxidoreductase [Francisellaceae bacterium]|nr:Thiol-disulfide oxidoreductase [Francisellaceae bacterium]